MFANVLICKLLSTTVQQLQTDRRIFIIRTLHKTCFGRSRNKHDTIFLINCLRFDNFFVLYFAQEYIDSCLRVATLNIVVCGMCDLFGDAPENEFCNVFWVETLNWLVGWLRNSRGRTREVGSDVTMLAQSVKRSLSARNNIRSTSRPCGGCRYCIVRFAHSKFSRCVVFRIWLVGFESFVRCTKRFGILELRKWCNLIIINRIDWWETNPSVHWISFSLCLYTATPRRAF